MSSAQAFEIFIAASTCNKTHPVEVCVHNYNKSSKMNCQVNSVVI